MTATALYTTPLCIAKSVEDTKRGEGKDEDEEEGWREEWTEGKLKGDSSAVRLCNVWRARRRPGMIAPPPHSPLLVPAVKVRAVPASITRQGHPYRQPVPTKANARSTPRVA